MARLNEPLVESVDSRKLLVYVEEARAKYNHSETQIHTAESRACSVRMQTLLQSINLIIETETTRSNL